VETKLISSSKVPQTLVAAIENRDAALWISGTLEDKALRESLASFISLPWKLVLWEGSDSAVVDLLKRPGRIADPLTRKRGFVQIVDTDPAQIDLPQRSLPVYLLEGRTGDPQSFSTQLRRLTMMDSLRRSGVRTLVVLEANSGEFPLSDLAQLWAAGFRAYTTFVSHSENVAAEVDAWLKRVDGIKTAVVLKVSPADMVRDVLLEYSSTYPESRVVIRIKNQRGETRAVDVTELDEPERPVLDSYSLIEERHLAPVLPNELSESELANFFKDSSASWRPYAAGLPWIRNSDGARKLHALLEKLDAVGPDENCIAYVASESGAGGTTFVRTLAWDLAREGYPVLIAKPVPFTPSALPIANLMRRVYEASEIDIKAVAHGRPDPTASERTAIRRYEAPWVIVFDYVHWHSRDGELVSFRNELEKSGRPVCILVVAGTVLGMSYYNPRVFSKLAELNHAIDLKEALELGHHLNRYLRVYGKSRTDEQWEEFYREHTVRYVDGLSAFWITLSFWLQGQLDLNESIQEWVYRSFRSNATDPVIQCSVLQVAALSSERLPLVNGLLPPSQGAWPTSQLMEDAKKGLGAVGLTSVVSGGQTYWALVHDLLGRLLLNAVYYDAAFRQELGYGDASSAEHFRFNVLRKISKSPLLGEKDFRSFGDDFALTIFKIDPDHGRGSFVSFWREVLQALDEMPRPLRDNSRVFRHHSAISRRRIAKLDERLYGIPIREKRDLLLRAIEDITYAIEFIDYEPGSDPNINLYNSLANAYFDLANIEEKMGSSDEQVAELRRLASDATRKAYSESPTNSFVIETYVKNLLEHAKASNNDQLDLLVEALGIVFSALSSGEAEYRRAQLGELADEALRLLLSLAPINKQTERPRSAIDVLINVWRILAKDATSTNFDLSEFSADAKKAALAALSESAGRGNMQVIRLTYDLYCLVNPLDFVRQLELIESLQSTNYRLSPQLRLEYSILLFQNSRPRDGEREFRALRKVWRETEHFVHIPNRLRWLLGSDKLPLAVHAFAASDSGSRPMARVNEFQNTLVPFRPEEHGLREVRPGAAFVCHVSFGHNGPFLRPTTAGPPRALS
jgi:tetratricopeptide (TPR) repeat protein